MRQQQNARAGVEAPYHWGEAPVRSTVGTAVRLFVSEKQGRSATISAASVPNAKIAAVIGSWNAIRASRPMPSRREIDPLAFPPECLPHLFIIDVQHEPLFFRYRLAGTDFEANVGMNLKGKTLADLPLDIAKTLLLNDYVALVERKMPVYAERRFTDRRGLPISIRRVLLPLSNSGGSVDGALGAIVFLPHDRQARIPSAVIDLG